MKKVVRWYIRDANLGCRGIQAGKSTLAGLEQVS